MKTWTMPRVEIEAFRTNEYVAACVDPGPVVGYAGYFYVDYNNSGTYDQYFESFPKTGDNTYKNNGHSDQVFTGWMNNVSLIPSKKISGANAGKSYNDSEYFGVPTTTKYDIYIYKKGANYLFNIYEAIPGGHSGVPSGSGTGAYFS